MKRLALVAAVLAFAAACSKSDYGAKDTAAPAMAPAPAPAVDTSKKMMDTGMKMMDTGMKKMDTGMKKMEAGKKKAKKP